MASIRKRVGARGAKYQCRAWVDGAAVVRTFETKDAAVRWGKLAELKRPVSSEAPARSVAALKLKDLIDDYVSDLTVGGTKLENYNSDKARIMELLTKTVGNWSIKRTDTSRLVEFFKVRATGVENGVKVGRSRAKGTIANEVTQFGLVWKHGAENMRLNIDEGVPSRVYKRLSKLGLAGASREVGRKITQEEIEALVGYWRKSPRLELPMEDILWFCLFTCMRIGEVCRIRREDWEDSATPSILIRDRKHPTKKAGNHHRIPLLGQSNEILQRRPVIEGEDRFFPYSSHLVSARFYYAKKALGLEGLRLHDLRHTGISILFENSWEIPEAAKISGHKDWKMLKRYENMDPAKLHKKKFETGFTMT